VILIKNTFIVKALCAIITLKAHQESAGIPEESPGCSKAGVSLTDCRRKTRESATEKKPPMGFEPQARVKR